MDYYSIGREKLPAFPLGLERRDTGPAAFTKKVVPHLLESKLGKEN
jgi:hypothetical protein